MVILHLAFLVFSAIVVLISDEQGLSWILGKTERLSRKRLTALHHLTWVGLGGLIISGILLLIPRTYALAMPFFQIKLLLVGVLVANAVLIGRLMPIATERSYRELTLQERTPLFVSGAISGLSWATVAAIGFWLFW